VKSKSVLVTDISANFTAKMIRYRYHKQILELFLNDLYEFYRFMQLYKINPNDNIKAEVRSKFEELIFKSYGYNELEQRLAVTWKNRDRLLQFLGHPCIPLPTMNRNRLFANLSYNDMISNGTRSSWESVMGKCIIDQGYLQKLGVNFFQYMQIFFKIFCQPRLADIDSHPSVY
jgi:hypothetical protein